MSYSFSVKSPNKALAKEAVAAKMEEVVRGQPVHAKDQAQAVAAASAFIDVLDDDDSKEVSVNMSGSLSGNWSGAELKSFSGANLSVSAALTTITAS